MDQAIFWGPKHKNIIERTTMAEGTNEKPEPSTHTDAADIPGRVAEVTLTDKTRLVGIVSEFRGSHWGHMRKFVESKAYTGLTQSGVALKLEGWDALVKIFEGMPEIKGLESEPESEKEWGRVEKSRTVAVVVRTLKDSGTAPGIKVDVREWVEGGKYTGWTKKGVRFAAEHLSELAPLYKAVSQALAAETQSSESSTE